MTEKRPRVLKSIVNHLLSWRLALLVGETEYLRKPTTSRKSLTNFIT